MVIKDKFSYNFWLTNDIDKTDMQRFIEQKILWNMHKIGMSKDDINRLIAFQCAVDKKGLTPLFRETEKEITKELKK